MRAGCRRRHALEGRTDEGRRAIDSPTLRRHLRFVFFLLIITGDCHLLIADNVVLPAFCAKTYRLRSTIDVQNGISKVSVGISLALLINRGALSDTAKYFTGILTEVSTSVRCSFGDHT